MQGTHDSAETTTADDGDRLDPREAARLFDQTKRDARRQFDLRPPVVSGVMAFVTLLGYGALWLSTRGQHPYSGPSAGAIVLVYAAVVVSIVVGARVYRRATAGVGGPSVRQQKIEGMVIGVSFIGSPVIQGALKHYGASHAIVYGVIPAAVPLIIVGTTLLGIAGTKADWPQFGSALVVITAGIVALFVGPSGAWLVAGIGVFLAVAGHAVGSAVLRGEHHGVFGVSPR